LPWWGGGDLEQIANDTEGSLLLFRLLCVLAFPFLHLRCTNLEQALQAIAPTFTLASRLVPPHKRTVHLGGQNLLQERAILKTVIYLAVGEVVWRWGSRNA